MVSRMPSQKRVWPLFWDCTSKLGGFFPMRAEAFALCMDTVLYVKTDASTSLTVRGFHGISSWSFFRFLPNSTTIPFFKFQPLKPAICPRSGNVCAPVLCQAASRGYLLSPLIVRVQYTYVSLWSSYRQKVETIQLDFVVIIKQNQISLSNNRKLTNLIDEREKLLKITNRLYTVHYRNRTGLRTKQILKAYYENLFYL